MLPPADRMAVPGGSWPTLAAATGVTAVGGGGAGWMGGRLDEGVVALMLLDDAVAGRMILCMLDCAFTLMGRVEGLGAWSYKSKIRI